MWSQIMYPVKKLFFESVGINVESDNVTSEEAFL